MGNKFRCTLLGYSELKNNINTNSLNKRHFVFHLPVFKFLVISKIKLHSFAQYESNIILQEFYSFKYEFLSLGKSRKFERFRDARASVVVYMNQTDLANTS